MLVKTLKLMFGSQLTNFDVLTYDGLADPACCENVFEG